MKLLHNVLPCHESMVLIVDDRSDVWAHSPGNVLRAHPFNFFKGMKETYVRTAAFVREGETQDSNGEVDREKGKKEVEEVVAKTTLVAKATQDNVLFSLLEVYDSLPKISSRAYHHPKT